MFTPHDSLSKLWTHVSLTISTIFQYSYWRAAEILFSPLDILIWMEPTGSKCNTSFCFGVSKYNYILVKHIPLNTLKVLWYFVQLIFKFSFMWMFWSSEKFKAGCLYNSWFKFTPSMQLSSNIKNWDMVLSNYSCK